MYCYTYAQNKYCAIILSLWEYIAKGDFKNEI